MTYNTLDSWCARFDSLKDSLGPVDGWVQKILLNVFRVEMER